MIGGTSRARSNRAAPRDLVDGSLTSNDHYEGLAEVLDSLPEQVVRYRLDDHTIVYCNASWASWYKLQPAEAIGHQLDEYLSEDGAEGLAAQLAILGPDNPLVVDKIARVIVPATASRQGLASSPSASASIG